MQALGGEIMARIAGLWQPVQDQIRDEGDLDDQRRAFEALLANFEVPPGVDVRPVNALGVQALMLTGAPDDPPGVLYLHGGGFVLGSAFGYRPLAGALALASGSGVLVPDYRLAPEHPYPAALDDAHAAYRWMLDRVGSPNRIVVAGDSSGAGLALALLLRLRDEGEPLPAAAALLSPITDLEAPTVAIDPDDPVQRTLGLFWRGCADAYLAGNPIDDPLVSPQRADLAGLPPPPIPGSR